MRTKLPTAIVALLGLSSTVAPSHAGIPIFVDGFETGDTSAWSESIGVVLAPVICTPPLAPVDTTTATTVGVGNPGSCTQAAFDAALANNNGQIRFNCGATPHTITVTSEKIVDDTLVIDGGGTVTLSGGGSTRILGLRVPFGTNPLPTLTIQNLGFVDGSTTHLPGGTTTSGGAAIYRDQGAHLNVINSRFADNTCPVTGQDVAGGAIYSFGAGTTTVVGSVFSGNACSSGGAIGALGVSANHLVLVNSILTNNAATGAGGNPGNGGNGGGMYFDGANQNVAICGSEISFNDANAAGGGIFRVSNNGVGGMSLDRTTVAGNFIPANPQSQAGGLYLQGLQTTITASTISNNTASSAGGMFVWINPGAQTLSMSNTTVAENQARTSLGAGMAVHSNVTGSLHHVTIARNANSGATSFASAISGGNSLTITNSLIADNTKVFTWEDVSCNVTHGGVGNEQWPSHNAGGELETLCATLSAGFRNPGLGPLQHNGGPTKTIAPSLPALANSLAVSCLATDQRGTARGATCSPGALEMP